MKYLFYLLLMLIYVSAQSQRTCATLDVLENNIKMNPGIINEMQQIENFTRKIQNNVVKRTTGIITIPVVFHIIYNHEGENLSEAQVLSQLDVLNEDFRRLNSDADNTWSQAADAEIEFCLATRDAQGDPTCGITWTQTDSTKFVKAAQGMKYTATGGIDAWPTDQYLNIWVCDIDGLLGFAQFPAGGAYETDGVVVDYRAFGTIGDNRPEFNLGRTATHEVGHWLNLRHIWGDGDCSEDDFIADTPLSDNANYGCTIGHESCGSVDMVQNYMDYSDDACMNLFTAGQKSRMRALFEPGGYRESLLNSRACKPEERMTQITLDIHFDQYPGDVTWRFEDEKGAVIAAGGPYGTPYAGLSITEPVSLPDGDIHFFIEDDYGDGICCDWGDGYYELLYQGDRFYYSPGNYGFGEDFIFSMDFYTFKFNGPGTDWDNPANWNTGKVPSKCFKGLIEIKSNCIKNGFLPDDLLTRIKVKPGFTLQIN